MAHVKSVEQSDGGRCGEQIEVARCRDKMLKLYQVRARNDLKHHHELGKMNPVIRKVLKMESGRSGAQTEVTIGIEKMDKNGVAKNNATR